MIKVTLLFFVFNLLTKINCDLRSFDNCGTYPSVNGSDPYKYGWTAQIHIDDPENKGQRIIDSPSCHANIIKPQWLLGSAACISDKIPLKHYKVHLQSRLKIFEPFDIDKVIKSPKYNPTLGAGYDLALIKLKRTITFDNFTRPICLADFDPQNPTKIEPVTSECLFNGAEIQMMDDINCQGIFHSLYKPHFMFCGDKPNCPLEANPNLRPNGAPIICSTDKTSNPQKTWYLAAMASWPRRCDQAEPQFEAYTKLFGDSNYISWINSTIQPLANSFVD